MTNYELHHKIADELDGLNDGRDVRALCVPMAVGQTDDFEFVVGSASSDRTYHVDTQLGRCSCPDHEQRNNHCQHLRKATFVSGQRVIPESVKRIGDVATDLIGADESIDLSLSLDASNVDGEPRWESEVRQQQSADETATAASEPADITHERDLVEQQAATDGGQKAVDAADSNDEGEELCGSTNTADGSPCGWAAADCPHDHHRQTDTDGSQSDATTDTGSEPASDGGEADTVAVADGSGDVGDAVEQAIDATDGDRPVVIVINV